MQSAFTRVLGHIACLLTMGEQFCFSAVTRNATKNRLQRCPEGLSHKDALLMSFIREADGSIFPGTAVGCLSCCCVFCEEGGFPPYRQQASAVIKMVPEAALYYTSCLLVSRCASRGENRYRLLHKFGDRHINRGSIRCSAVLKPVE